MWWWNICLEYPHRSGKLVTISVVLMLRGISECCGLDPQWHSHSRVHFFYHLVQQFLFSFVIQLIHEGTNMVICPCWFFAFSIVCPRSCVQFLASNFLFLFTWFHTRI